jgi:hypothetical protein
VVTATRIKPYREITPEGKYILNLHPGQSKAWESRARFIVMTAGTQGGKTCFEPDWLRREINTCGTGDYLVITATFPLLELKLLPEFLFVFETTFKLGTYSDSKKILQFHHAAPGTKGSVNVIDKSRIVFGSATHPESVESATAKAAILDECGQKQFLLGTWEAIQRRLSLSQGRCLFGTTLYNSGWFINEIYEPALRNEKDFELIQFDSVVNPMFPREEYERAMSTLPNWKFAMFYKGKFLRPAGLVYDSFDPAACKIPRFDIPKNWLIYVGHDFGSANPAAIFYAQDPATGIFYAYYEYLPGQGRSTYDHVQEIKRITTGYNVISRIGGNQTTEDEIRQGYTVHGWHIQAPKWKHVEKQIENVYALNKLNKVKVFSDLHNYLDEKLSFSYVLDEKYQPTDKLEDEQKYHLLAAERYILSDFTPETVAHGNSRSKAVY